MLNLREPILSFFSSYAFFSFSVTICDFIRLFVVDYIRLVAFASVRLDAALRLTDMESMLL